MFRLSSALRPRPLITEPRARKVLQLPHSLIQMRKPWTESGNVGLSAKRADRAGMDGRAAVRTLPLQQFPAHRAVPAADGIRRLVVGTEKTHLLYEVPVVRRTRRIRTERARTEPVNGRPEGNSRGLPIRLTLLLGEGEVELLRYPPNHLVVELRPVTLLEHRKRGLLASDLGCKLSLRQTRRAASRPYAPAELWIQVFHNTDIMDFIL